MTITKEDRERLKNFGHCRCPHCHGSIVEIALRAVADSDAAHAGLQALETEFNRVVAERDELKKERDHIFHPANWPGEDGVYHRPAAREAIQDPESIDLDARLQGLRRANDGSAITVWKDGTWRHWQTLDAKYAEKDPDWLCTIPLAEEVPQKAAEDVETVIAWLETHYKYLANPLTGNERALVGDVLKALSAPTPAEPTIYLDTKARDGMHRALKRSGEVVEGPKFKSPNPMSEDRLAAILWHEDPDDGDYNKYARRVLQHAKVMEKTPAESEGA